MKSKKFGRRAIIILAAAIIVSAVFAVIFLFEASVKSETITEFYSKNAFTTEDESGFSVMTWNIRRTTAADKGVRSFKKRSEKMLRLIKSTDSDIICMQEATSSQISFFKKHMHGMNVSYAYRDKARSSECCPVFYNSNRFELISSETFWLSDTPEKISKTWEADYYRICTTVKLKDKLTGKELALFNTHIDYKSEDTKLKSVELINEKAAEFDCPIVLTGDFNSVPESSAIERAKTYFTEAGEGKPDGDKITFNNYLGAGQKKIDYVFYKGNLESLSYNVIDKTYGKIIPSDHYPIKAEFTYL